MILLMALLDMIGVISILPFIAVLLNPEIIETNSILNYMFKISATLGIDSMFKISATLGIDSKQQFLFCLGSIFFILLVFSLAFKALTTYVQFRFTEMRAFSIGKRLVEGYLYQPYSWFLNRNSAELGKTIISQVTSVVSNGIRPMVNLIANIIYKLVRGILKKIGHESVKADQSRFITLSEAFGASKEVKLGSLEDIYIKRFADASQKHASNQASAKSISQIPRYILEAIAFGGMLLFVLFLVEEGGMLDTVLPIVALYAFAGYRLMPALQQTYASFSLLRFVGPALDYLYNDLKNLEKKTFLENKHKLSFDNEITLNKINYSYPNTPRNVLKNLSINIPAHKSIGIVGKTGSGKTTLVDIILCLLDVKEGTLKIDGQIINRDNQISWQRYIGYVPQKIYLADDTIAANIAFGKNFENINMDKLISAAKVANLHEFIIDELPLQYQTTVGENGVKLSGGQRQRIGIARALYNEPKVLVLDEATSALDNQTEKLVMEALNNASKEITIIMIAHRLSTIKKCDKIFLLQDGEVKAEGSYDELIKSNNFFKSFTNKS
jgi:ABC-type bacteriocin/lantibiotic exporter with double-glycine peptidase domain